MRELLGLYSKYGMSEFQRAIQVLESGEYRDIFLRALRVTETAGASTNTSARTESTIHSKRKKQPKEYLAEFISELSERGTDDSRRIASFVTEIAERRLLSNAAVLRDYSRRMGLSVDGKMDRATVARKIGETILSQSSEVRNNNIQLAARMGSQESTLQAWSDIIVKDNK